MKHSSREWNSNVVYAKVPKRREKMLKDARKFAKLDEHNFIDRDSACTVPTEFDSISTTFGFKHHEGTSYSLEIKIIKLILLRQSLLMTLRHMCDYLNERSLASSEPQPLLKDEGEKIIQLLKKLRDYTVDLLELVQLWRQSSQSDSRAPLPFVWEGENYLLKVMIDLDFIADTPALVAALNIGVDRYLTNPLMLPNTLNEGDPTADIRERAAFDAGGDTAGQLFDERLRIRKAELLLMREIEHQTKRHSGTLGDEQALPVEERAVLAPPPDMVSFGRPPTREGESRENSRGALLSGGGSRSRNGNGLDSIRQGEVFDAPREVSFVNITFADVERVVKVAAPPLALQLAASAILVLVTDKYQRPEDLSWSKFLGCCASTDLSWELNALDVTLIQDTQLSVMAPILFKLYECREEESLTAGSEDDKVARKIIKWVIQTTNALFEKVNEPKRLQSQPAALGIPRPARKRDPLPFTKTKERAVKIYMSPHKRKYVGLQLEMKEVCRKTLVDPARFANSVELTLIAPDTDDPKLFNRLVVKVADGALSSEITVTVKDYVLFQHDMKSKYGAVAMEAYEPTSVDWWISCIDLIIVLKVASGKLLMTVAKSLIEKLIAQSVESKSSSPSTAAKFPSRIKSTVVSNSTSALPNAKPTSNPPQSSESRLARQASVSVSQAPLSAPKPSRSSQTVAKSRSSERQDVTKPAAAALPKPSKLNPIPAAYRAPRAPSPKRTVVEPVIKKAPESKTTTAYPPVAASSSGVLPLAQPNLAEEESNPESKVEVASSDGYDDDFAEAPPDAAVETSTEESASLLLSDKLSAQNSNQDEIVRSSSGPAIPPLVSDTSQESEGRVDGVVDDNDESFVEKRESYYDESFEVETSKVLAEVSENLGGVTVEGDGIAKAVALRETLPEPSRSAEPGEQVLVSDSAAPFATSANANDNELDIGSAVDTGLADNAEKDIPERAVFEEYVERSNAEKRDADSAPTAQAAEEEVVEVVPASPTSTVALVSAADEANTEDLRRAQGRQPEVSRNASADIANAEDTAAVSVPVNEIEQDSCADYDGDFEGEALQGADVDTSLEGRDPQLQFLDQGSAVEYEGDFDAGSTSSLGAAQPIIQPPEALEAEDSHCYDEEFEDETPSLPRTAPILGPTSGQV